MCQLVTISATKTACVPNQENSYPGICEWRRRNSADTEHGAGDGGGDKGETDWIRETGVGWWCAGRAGSSQAN